MTDNLTAVGLFSGGLDSTLAVRIMKDEGFNVIALYCYTGFNGSVKREIENGSDWVWSPEPRIVESAQKLGVRLLPMDVSGDYLNILLKPRYGYGSGANPCVDCHILFLKKAREIMEQEGAIVVFTGEVLSQRPMSQFRSTLALVEERSGLKGRLLRPLSAKLLEPTIPENEGLINRDHLYDFHGRSRKPQQNLAHSLGIDWYPTPAGGCLLTDMSFGKKFRDLVNHADIHPITLRDLNSLKVGRHLRLPSGVKVIIGRTKEENVYLTSLLSDTCWYFEARDFSGATAFALDELKEDDFSFIASLTARYGKGLNETTVVVAAKKGSNIREIEVKPAEQHLIQPLIIM